MPGAVIFSGAFGLRDGPGLRPGTAGGIWAGCGEGNATMVVPPPTLGGTTMAVMSELARPESQWYEWICMGAVACAPRQSQQAASHERAFPRYRTNARDRCTSPIKSWLDAHTA